MPNFIGFEYSLFIAVQPTLISSLHTLKYVEPVRLLVVLCREHARVDEDKNNNKPVEPLRLDARTTGFATFFSPRNHSPPTQPSMRMF